jgi:hypothetical protein
MTESEETPQSPEAPEAPVTPDEEGSPEETPTKDKTSPRGNQERDEGKIEEGKESWERVVGN